MSHLKTPKKDFTTVLLQWQYTADIGFVSLLLVLPFFLLGTVTVGGKTLVPSDLLLLMPPWKAYARELFPDIRGARVPLLDVIQQYYPWRHFYKESILSGTIPLWNPYMFCGTPFLGNGISGVFYPLGVMFLLFDLPSAFGWYALLHLMFAGTGLYAFARLHLSPLASFVGALTFQFSGFLMAWLAYTPVLGSAVWLPWILWGLELSWRKPDHKIGSPLRSSLPSVGWAAVSGIAIGLSVLAGHPQIVFYAIWVTGVFGLVTALIKRSLVPLWSAVIALVTGWTLSAAQVLPLLEFGQLSSRAAEPLVTPLATNLPADQWVRLFVPKFFGTWADGTHWEPAAEFSYIEKTGYPGTAAWVLAVVALCTLRTSPGQKNGAWRLAVVGLIYSVAALFSASHVTYHRIISLWLPGAASFVGVSRAILMLDLGVALLAAIGVETLLGADDRSLLLCNGVRKAVLLLGAFYSLVIFTALVVHQERAFYPLLVHNTISALLCNTLILVIIAGLILWLVACRQEQWARRKKLVGALLPVVMISDALATHWDQHPRAPVKALFFETRAISWLRDHAGHWRVLCAGTDPVRNWIPSNTLMMFFLRDAQGSDSLVLGKFAQFLKKWDSQAPGFAVRSFDSPFLDLMSVRYIIVPHFFEISETSSLKAVYRGEVNIYENRNALPRARLIAIRDLSKGGGDSVRRLYSFSRVGRGRLNRSPEGGTELIESTEGVRFIRDDPNLVELEGAFEGGSAMILQDVFYPGWRAFAKSAGNWTERRVRPVKFVFRVIRLPKTAEKVAWVFYPGSVTVGIFLTLTALGWLFALLGWCLNHFVSRRAHGG